MGNDKSKNNYLYRGVSKELDNKLGGKIIGRGNKEELTMLIGKYSDIHIGNFIIGADKKNTARLQHIQNGLENGCAISSSKSLKVAKEFATNHYSTDGYVYIFDREILEKYSVELIDLDEPLHPYEVEITLIVPNCKELPKEAIIDKFEVLKSDNKMIMEK